MRRSTLRATSLVLAVLATGLAVSGLLLRSHPASSFVGGARTQPSSFAPPPVLPPPATGAPDVEPGARPLAADPAPDEATLMERLRRAASNPGLAIDLADEGDRRFPASAGASERASARIHALAEQGRSAEARGEAESVVNRYPDSQWIREIETFTGAHRHRNLRVTPDGSLEYY